jgi:Protein of unknown function (DUF1444)
MNMMNIEQFRDYVMSILSQRFPRRQFRVTDDPHIILWGDAQLGLQNLYVDYKREALSVAQLDDLIFEYFTRILGEIDLRSESEPLTWDAVRNRVRLQLMPAEFASRAPLVSFPFLDDVLVGVVVDSPTGYVYVRDEDVKSWGQNAIDLYEVAVRNLNEASTGIAISFMPPPNALIGVEAKDGYDAARILVPGIRDLASEKLGEPFFAAIPNRDFLIMWSVSNPDNFHKFARGKVAKDFSEQSHPLTPTVLKVTRESISPEH